jgi:dienelactone hydrolase
VYNRAMKWIISISVFLLVSIACIYLYLQKGNLQSPIGKTIDQIVEKPLEKYSFENLRNTTITPSEILIGKELKNEEDFVSHEFSYCMDSQFIPKSQTTGGKNESQAQCPRGSRVTGLINIPKTPGTYPVLVMYRGFVPREAFTTGEGTRRTAEEFARRGFITLAPDFLGYGGSDAGSTDSLEDRFQTYPTALTLLASVPNLKQALTEFEAQQLQITPTGTLLEISEFTPIVGVSADTSKVGIWGHSNGGHIALSVLAVTGQKTPTVLWNPVTKSFPYSILFFTDEYEDEGKGLRKIIADFEEKYDIFLYSPSKYYSWIQAPIQLHQAINDEAVPVRWSDQFIATMESLDKDIEYFTYPNENHNFNLGSWEEVMDLNEDFYTTQFEETSQ